MAAEGRSRPTILSQRWEACPERSRRVLCHPKAEYGLPLHSLAHGGLAPPLPALQKWAPVTTPPDAAMRRKAELNDDDVTCPWLSPPKRVQSLPDASRKCRFAPIHFAAHGKRQVVATPSPGCNRFFSRPDDRRFQENGIVCDMPALYFDF